MLKLGLKQADLVEKTGASKTTISFWLNGKNEASGKNLLALAEVLQCSAGWLATGIGSPEIGMVSEKHQQYGVEVAPEWATAKVAVMDQAFSAGQGATAEHVDDFVDGYEEIKHSDLSASSILSVNARIIKIRGDSMWPTLWDGDKVLADTSVPRLVSGKIYAFAFDGDLKVKRFTKRIDGSWLISSDNKDDPSYVDEILSAHNAQQLRIIAEVKRLIDRPM